MFPRCPKCNSDMKLSSGYHGVGEFENTIDLTCEKCGLVLEIVHFKEKVKSEIKLNEKLKEI